MRIPLCLLSLGIALAQDPRTESYLGNLAPVMRSIQQERGFPMDYAHRQGITVEQWRARGRAEVLRALSYSPKTVPLDVKVDRVEKRSGYELRVVSFAGSAHYRIPAYLLVPTSSAGPFPAAVALHDHGGWFFHGKEKLVSMPGEHASLNEFRAQYYAGRAFRGGPGAPRIRGDRPRCILLGRAAPAIQGSAARSEATARLVGSSVGRVRPRDECLLPGPQLGIEHVAFFFGDELDGHRVV
jgi:hypothetical protein